MIKKITSFRLSERAKLVLRRRAVEEQRSATKHLEYLILEDARRHPVRITLRQQTSTADVPSDKTRQDQERESTV